MRVQDLTGASEAETNADLEHALGRRLGEHSVNAFWFSHGDTLSPTLVVLVRANLASLHYFPEDGHPGFASRGRVPGLNPAGETVFFLNNLTEEQPMLNESVVTVAEALVAVQEFMVSQVLPTALDWFEL